MNTISDSVLGGPVRLRISNERSHAEEFEAATLDEFSCELLAAISRFKSWTITRFPPYQTIKRTEAAKIGLPRLQLHLRDTHYELNRTPLTARWILVKHQGMIPVVSTSAWEQDGGATLWVAIVYTMNHIEQFAKFMGYHESGEDRLGEFLSTQLPPHTK